MYFYTSNLLIIYFKLVLLTIVVRWIVRPNSSMMKLTLERLTDNNIVQRSIWEVKHAPGIDVGRTD